MQNGKEVSRRHVKLFEPHLRKGDEEELLRSELGQPRKPGLGSKLLHGVDVGPEWLVKSSVVGDVLSLSEDSIQLKRNRINKVSSWRNKYKLNCFFFQHADVELKMKEASRALFSIWKQE